MVPPLGILKGGKDPHETPKGGERRFPPSGDDRRERRELSGEQLYYMNPEAEPLGGIERELGSQILRGSARGTVADPEGIGVSLAEDLLGRGAREILDEVYRAAGS